MGAKARVIHDALGLNCGSCSLCFGVLPGGKFPGGLGEVVFGFLPEKRQRSQGPDSHLGLKGGGPESARLGCFALPSTFSSLYTAAEKYHPNTML